ncbi:hypothetical protein BC943DRAFT_324160 [Umbelopsis sp. AD052]|nr:hypothetical protein BC943DRAFT_324160 [Umbelopsis sp. AD052]
MYHITFFILLERKKERTVCTKMIGDTCLPGVNNGSCPNRLSGVVTFSKTSPAAVLESSFMDADLDLLQHNQHHLLHKILSDLLSDDEIAQRRVLDKYYLPNAKLTSPLISVQGIESIKNVFKLRSTLIVKPPTMTTKIFDYWTCAIHLTNYIKIPFIPLVLSIPSWMILHFKETDQDSRLLKVWWHEDSWTIEGGQHILLFTPQNRD